MTEFRKLFSFKQREIDSAFQAASKRSSILGIKLLSAPNPDLPYGKLLIVTPATIGNSYHRNKIRRQIKAIFYENELYKQPGIWIMIVYKEAIKVSFDDIKTFMLRSMS